MAGQRISRGKRMLAGLSALALASAGMVSLGSAAHAVLDPAPLSVGNIDPAQTGSITVHKHANRDANATPGAIDGSAPITDPGLADVEFTVQKLDVDLTTSAGWDSLQGVTATSACAPSGAGIDGGFTPVAVTTDSDGLANFPGLAVGAYLVCETDAPASVVDRAAPFIVAIPFPNTNDWLYDVHVYPKNTVAGTPVKDVSTPSGLVLGSTVEFPVSMEIPNPGPDGFSAFSVSDDLDMRLAPVANGVKSSVISGSPQIDMVLDVHYKVNAAGNNITVEILPAGLAVMNGTPAETLTVTFEATVIGLGDIDNKAIVNINESLFNTNEVNTRWGGVEITKFDVANEATLAGATFQIWEAASPYAATCDVMTAGSPLEIDGVSSFTTGADGTVMIPGVFISDSNTPGEPTERCYVLLETAAPTGYVLPTIATTAVKVSSDVEAQVVVAIANAKQGGPELPLTGAAGQLLMVAGGSAVLIVGAGLMVASRRRSKVQN